jgi:hypothetical protein
MFSSNPRRTLVTRIPETDTGNALTLKTTMTLRKGVTFHSPTSPVLSPTEAFIAPPLIRRSQTNLDDVVDAHRRRVALTLDHIDKSLSTQEESSSSSSTKKRALRDNSLPVPRGFLGPPIVDPAMAKDATETDRRVLRPRHTRRSTRHHESDSGLGTSIVSSKLEKQSSTTTKRDIKMSRSPAASSTTVENHPGLSSRAVNRIHEHILRPLRAKPSLKDFEPIVLDVPRRIQDKEIICLRDLEKTLIFMAPVSQLLTDSGAWGDAYRTMMKERTKTADLYLDFCLTSIRCIQATVEYLSDREQIRPNDRMYTNGYFIDLVDQIRQYATQLASAKEDGEDGMDVDPYVPHALRTLSGSNMPLRTDEIKLFGGLSENGRPAQLVRVKKDGKAISMATGKMVDMDDGMNGSIKMKRSLSQQAEDEDEIMRSMARRKKNASPDEYAPKKCREAGCNKEFKRPCDLTKHEKTHSRPWKCPVTTCKYHEYGWPTEKEMDRHHNDKHSSAPPMYECGFKPCPYKSKRESNCKQHMEKAHGWEYLRTKTNGKKVGSSKPSSVTQPTPLLGNMPTPTSNPSIGVATPPDDHPSRFVSNFNRLDFPSYVTDEEFHSATYGHQPMILDDIRVDFSPLDRDSPSTEASYGQYSTYQNGPEFTLNEDIYSAHAQLPTPDQSAFGKILTGFPAYQTNEVCQPQQAAHISPIGQGNAMLFTPNSLADGDEGFEDYPAAGGNMGGDFQLYPSTPVAKADNFESLFAELPSAGLGFSQHSSQDIFQQLDWAAMDYASQNYQHH